MDLHQSTTTLSNIRYARCNKARNWRAFYYLAKAMLITEQQLLQILPNAGRQAGVFVPGAKYERH